MIEKQDDAQFEHQPAEKSPWISPTVSRLLAGDAENNPGDTHSDGSATFS
ncbi:MAG: hypothetical protein ACXW2T_09250 [Allosphingosinicella sp.]